MKRLVFIMAIGLIIVIGYGPPNTASAAANPTMMVGMVYDAGTCQDSYYEVEFGWLNTETDGPLFDYVGLLVYDANGVRIAADWSGYSPGTTTNWIAYFGTNINSSLADGMNDITARPLTLKMYDLYEEPPLGYNNNVVYDAILDQAANGAELMLTVQYDPANDQPDCASLPYLGSSPPPAPGPCDPCGSGDYDRIGQIMITTGQSQPGLTAPNGATAKAQNGADIILPFDADGNGFDTYDVIDSVTVDGRQWVSIFLGDSDSPVWVPRDRVTPLTSLPGYNPMSIQ